jgi:signal transduction histidine kinase
MLSSLRSLAAWGVTEDTPSWLVEHYRVTNLVLAFMVIGSIGQTLVCFTSGAIASGYLNALAPLCFGSALLLMKSGHTILARVLVFAVASSLGYVFLASVGPDSGFQYIFLFASALATGMFSIRERRLLAFGILAPLTCLIALEITGFKPVIIPRALISVADLKVMRITSLMSVWLMMVAYFLFFVIDRQRSQAKLIASAKMVALGRMAAGIAHEINNPLQLIMSRAETIKVALNAGDMNQVSTMADQIQAVTMRIASINKGLIALSRDTQGDPLVPVSIGEVIRLSFEFCRARFESKKIKIRFDEPAETFMTMGRETQLAEVILNILNNAYDAVEDRDERWVCIEIAAENQKWIEIAISDSGPGIEDSILPRIFDPFFTTKPTGRGTGLGLSICQAVISDHEGDIVYDPNRPRSTFVIRLPRLE